jgi:hypothetical protein
VTIYVGETASEIFSTGVAGETWTFPVKRINGASASYGITVTDLTGGRYEYAVTPVVPGEYAFVMVGSLTGDWPVNFGVEAASTAAATIAATTGQTRKVLRRMVGRGLGDCVVCVATAAGNTQTFLDDDHLDGPDNAYKGMDLYVTGGTAANLGQRRRLTASTQASGLVTWQKVLPAATAEGDEAELWNTRGIAIKPTEINDFINDSIVFAGEQRDIPVEAAVVAAFDRDDPRLVVPAAITRGVYAVVWEDDEGFIQTVEPANGYGAYGWFYDKSSQRIVIGGGEYLGLMDGQTVTVKGVGAPATLAADTDTTSINVEWLVAEAKRMAVTAMRMRNPDAERYLPPHWQESMQKRDLPSGRGIPNLVRL